LYLVSVILCTRIKTQTLCRHLHMYVACDMRLLPRLVCPLSIAELSGNGTVTVVQLEDLIYEIIMHIYCCCLVW